MFDDFGPLMAGFVFQRIKIAAYLAGKKFSIMVYAVIDTNVIVSALITKRADSPV